jgi:hypothetical protein
MDGGRRWALVWPTHCQECVTELRERGYFIRREDGEEHDPDRTG